MATYRYYIRRYIYIYTGGSTYPKITAFHSMMLLSWGAPLIPAGGSCCNLLKSRIRRLRDGVDMLSDPNTNRERERERERERQIAQEQREVGNKWWPKNGKGGEGGKEERPKKQEGHWEYENREK